MRVLILYFCNGIGIDWFALIYYSGLNHDSHLFQLPLQAGLLWAYEQSNFALSLKGERLEVEVSWYRQMSFPNTLDSLKALDFALFNGKGRIAPCGRFIGLSNAKSIEAKPDTGRAS